MENHLILRVLILGYGEMGHAIEHLLAARHDVRIWNMGMEVLGRGATLEVEVADAQVILFCLPVYPHHEIACLIEPHLTKDSLCLTIAKGLDESGRTAAQIFESVFARKHTLRRCVWPDDRGRVARGTAWVRRCGVVEHGGLAGNARSVLRQHAGLPAGERHARRGGAT